MIHRAILGSIERFIGILIEEYAGKFPVWLAPVQAVVMNISEHQTKYSLKITDSLNTSGIRVITDVRNEKIGFKIREQTLQRIPYLLVVGNKEVEEQTIAVRSRDGADMGSMSIDSFVSLVKSQVASKV